MQSLICSKHIIRQRLESEPILFCRETQTHTGKNVRPTLLWLYSNESVMEHQCLIKESQFLQTVVLLLKNQLLVFMFVGVEKKWGIGWGGGGD